METRRHWMTFAVAWFAAGACWAQAQAPDPPRIERDVPPVRGMQPATPTPPPIAGPRGDRGINSRGLSGGSGAGGIVGTPATNGAIDRNPAHRQARQAAAAEAAASATPLPEACADGSALLARSPTGEVIDCPRPGEGAKPVQPTRP